MTASWSAARDAVLAGIAIEPVRTSVGVPKFWPEARAFPQIAEVTPYGLLDLQGDEYATAYLARLDRYGIERIVAAINAIHAAHGKTLALCCFEHDRADCHRGLLAAWFEQQTGTALHELTVESAQQALDLGDVSPANMSHPMRQSNLATTPHRPTSGQLPRTATDDPRARCRIRPRRRRSAGEGRAQFGRTGQVWVTEPHP